MRSVGWIESTARFQLRSLCLHITFCCAWCSRIKSKNVST